MASRWQDCTHRGMWTHSLLFSDEGVYLAMCWPYRREDFGPVVNVSWDTENGDEGTEDTRRNAKRAARKAVRDQGASSSPELLP